MIETLRDFLTLFQVVLDDIPLRNLGGIFDAVNDSNDFGIPSRSAHPSSSILSNRSGWYT